MSFNHRAPSTHRRSRLSNHQLYRKANQLRTNQFADHVSLLQVFFLSLVFSACGCDRESATVPTSSVPAVAAQPSVSTEKTSATDSEAVDSGIFQGNDLEQGHGAEQPEQGDVDTFPWPSDGEVGWVAEFAHHTKCEATGGHRCHSVAWSPDERLIASGGADGTIVVRDIVEDKIIKQWRPTENRIRSLHFSPGNHYLLSDDDNTGVRIWSLENYEELGSNSRAAHGVFLEDEKVLASLRNTGVVGTWSPAAAGKPQKLADAGKTVFSLDVDETHDLIVTASWEGTVQLRQLAGGDLVRDWDIFGREVAVSQSGTYVLAGVGEDSSVRLLSSDSGEEIWRRTGIVCCDADFVDEHGMILTGGWSDKTPCMAWDLERGRAIRYFGRAKAVGDLAVSPGRRFMATASTDGYVRIFRLPDEDQIEASLQEVDEKALEALAYAKRSRTYQQWITRLNQAIDLDPGLAEAYYLRAQRKERAGIDKTSQDLLDEAAEDYLTAIRWDATYWKWHFECASLHSDLGRLEIADNHYRQAIDLIRENDGMDDETRKFLAWSYLNNCDVLIRMNRSQEATEFGDDAVDVAGMMSMTHYNRGRAYAASRVYDVALEAFQRAIELSGDLRFLRNLHLALANVYFDLGELDPAYRHLRASMMLPFVDPGQVQMLAVLELLRGRFENAIGTVTPLAAMADAPGNVNLIAGEAWAAAGDLDQAADEFRKTLQAETISPRAHVFLGEIQAKHGDQEGSQQSFRDALAAFDKLVAANEDDPSPRTNRGAFFMRTAQMDEAREDFAAATNLDRRFFWALGNLSLTYSVSADPAQRDGKKALALADQACEISLQRNGWCLSVRAAALAELGRFDEAEDTQLKAVELCPSIEVHKYRERLRLYQRGKAFRFSPEGDLEPWLALDRVVVPHKEAPVGTFDCFPEGEPPPPQPKTEIAKKQDAVVLIKSDSGFGTGMILDKRGYVLTCAHVLPYAGPVTVHFGAAGSLPPGNLTEEAEVIAADHRNDLALLRFIPPKDVELATVALGVASEVAAAEDVVVIGNPGLGDFVLDKPAHNGSVASVRQSVGSLVKRPHLQINADVAPGFSGGPVFNLRGEVIGVIDQMASLPRTSFAIPMEVVAEFLGVPVR